MRWSAIGRAKLMMIGSPTPTVAPLTGLNVGGTNGAAPVNGSGFWPTTGPAGAAAAGEAGGTAGCGAMGSTGAGGGATGLGGGTASGSAGKGGGAGSPGGGGAGASTAGAGAGGGGGSGSASAKPLPNTSAAVTPTALHAAARGPVVQRDICIPPSHDLNPVCSSGGPSY